MAIDDAMKRPHADTKILATDLSTNALRSGLAGRYDKKRLADVPPGYRQRYFTRDRTAADATFVVNEALKELIRFRRLNLSCSPYPMRGPFDAIFCRNVMIYFDHEMRKKTLNEAYRLLKPGGYLFVGSAESLMGIANKFDLVRPTIYKKPA